MTSSLSYGKRSNRLLPLRLASSPPSASRAGPGCHPVLVPLPCVHACARVKRAERSLLRPPEVPVFFAGAPAGGRIPITAAAARDGEYSCAAAYPDAARSLRLGRQNLHLFRLKNTRFDVVGGILYFVFVVRQSCALSLLQRPAAVMPGPCAPHSPLGLASLCTACTQPYRRSAMRRHFTIANDHDSWFHQPHYDHDRRLYVRSACRSVLYLGARRSAPHCRRRR